MYSNLNSFLKVYQIGGWGDGSVCKVPVLENGSFLSKLGAVTHICYPSTRKTAGPLELKPARLAECWVPPSSVRDLVSATKAESNSRKHLVLTSGWTLMHMHTYTEHQNRCDLILTYGQCVACLSLHHILSAWEWGTEHPGTRALPSTCVFPSLLFPAVCKLVIQKTWESR